MFNYMKISSAVTGKNATLGNVKGRYCCDLLIQC